MRVKVKFASKKCSELTNKDVKTVKKIILPSTKPTPHFDNLN